MKKMNVANEWKDYEILDMADGQKLERWGNVILIRPDPQIIWKNKSFPEKWNKANAKSHARHRRYIGRHLTSNQPFLF